ncbi:hypothetical protein [Halomicronema sp. CCY15110]|uniref:hypothetical protein n=1 Tax=Halomicronema sp. CCY15110 TaxID=2767773 RepID=UPI00194EF3A6|nr:hypothetical protein [Halomicronema sp. CCY15110]
MNIEYLLSSNLVQTFLTFVVGLVLCFGIQKKPALLTWVAVLVSSGIFFSFLFDIGEVYSYNFSYKRAFLFFGDDVSTVLIFLFLCSIALGKKYTSALCMSAIFLSGGKVSYGLLMLAILLISIFSQRLSFGAVFRRYLSYVAVGIVVYFSMIGYARMIEYSGAGAVVQSAYVNTRDALVTVFDRLNLASELESEDSRDLDITVRGRGTCSQISFAECFVRQLESAFGQRLYSSIAGLWMTLQGGFRGADYPGTAQEFATLMTTHNPWGINDRYDLDFDDWQKMGQVQNPYLLFGSGYGAVGLLMLVTVFIVIAGFALRRLAQGRGGLVAACSAFFVINAVFNQSQPWILPRSNLLLIMGICTGFILFFSMTPKSPSLVRKRLILTK